MADKSKELMGLTKDSFNKDNKAQNHVVSEKGVKFTVKVASFTDRGKTFVGWGQLDLFKVNEAGLKAAKDSLTEADLIDLNRQKITDVRNTVARLGDIQKAVAKVKAGTATSDEFKQVMAAGLKGNLGSDIQAELNKVLASALSGNK
jgi:hypothetical protein